MSNLFEGKKYIFPFKEVRRAIWKDPHPPQSGMVDVEQRRELKIDFEDGHSIELNEEEGERFLEEWKEWAT